MEDDVTRYKLPADVHEYLYNELKSECLRGKSPVQRPTAIILGGQPGAGKTILIREALRDFKDGNVVVINGDEFRKAHPSVEDILRSHEEDLAYYTDVDVREWTKHIFSSAIEEKYNIIFEGTMRTNAICNTLRKLKEQGYRVIVRALSVNGVESILSTFERYEAQRAEKGHGRATPRVSHKEAYYGMLDTLEEIEELGCYDSLEVSTREGEVVYFRGPNTYFSKYNTGIRESVELSRREQRVPSNEVRHRVERISNARVARGLEPLNFNFEEEQPEVYATPHEANDTQPTYTPPTLTLKKPIPTDKEFY